MFRIQHSLRAFIIMTFVCLCASAAGAQTGTAKAPAPVPAVGILPQTTAFNFQGRLNDGTSPANGRYDLQFKLFDAIAGGGQVGPTLDRPNLLLINGVFGTQLDFGSAAFIGGGDRFLEIGLRPTGSTNEFVIMGPRQQFLSVPFATRSLRAAFADDATHAAQATNALNLGGVPAAGFVQQDASGNITTPGTVTAGLVKAQTQTAAPGLVHTDGTVSVGTFVGAGANTPAGGWFGTFTNHPLYFFTNNGAPSMTLDVAGNLKTAGNISQPLRTDGLPKAVITLDRAGHFMRCYNGMTGEYDQAFIVDGQLNTRKNGRDNCGFAVIHPEAGIYVVNLNYDVFGSTIIATSEYDSGDTTATVDRTHQHYTVQCPTPGARIVGSTYSEDGCFIIAVNYITAAHAGELTNASVHIVVY